ncbi:MAG TPA: murein biosynthesis integral membrane protein MurJ, partial [Anaeromyxobacteraceae bacterium]|nr:murein biosynthesis integral membrane protein MurJ [Anaeromyxobacteraceae bacterium]
VLGAVAWAVHAALRRAVPGHGLAPLAIRALLPIAAAGVAYLAAARLLRLGELAAFTAALRRRARPRPSSPPR